MKKQKQTDIARSVMEQIQQGDITMRPRAHYIVFGIVSLGAAISATISIAYLTSILVLWLRIQTSETMAWGARANLADTIADFPWWAAVLSIALFTLAVWLIKRQGRMYRHHTAVIVLMLALVSLTLGIGFSFLETGTHTPRRDGQSQHGGYGRGQFVK